MNELIITESDHKYTPSLLVYIWSMFIYSSILLPSGSVFEFNIKIIISLFLVVGVMVFCLKNQLITRKEILLITIFNLFILFFSWISILNGYAISAVFSQLVAIFSIVLPMWIGKKLITTGELAINFARKTIIAVAIVHGLIKIISFLCIVLGFITLEEYVTFQKIVFGVTPISLELDGFTRLNVPSDFIFPIAIAVCISYESEKFKKIISVSVFLAAVIISYSRYLWLYTFICILSSFFMSFSSGKNIRIWWLILIILLLSVFFMIMVQYEDNFIVNFIVERYKGDNAESSDYTRTIMYDWLYNNIMDSLLIGYGLGSYVHQFIRFDDTPWNYELQWLSIILNFGILGLLYILSQFFIYYIDGFSYLFKQKKFSKIYMWSVTLLMWFAVGFINCFLITSSAGVVFFSFWLYLNVERYSVIYGSD